VTLGLFFGVNMKRKKPNPYEVPKPRYVPSEKYKRPAFTTLKPRQSRLVYLDQEPIPSSNEFTIDPNLHVSKIEYEDEMRIREEAAIKEQKRRAKMLVPLYNKGPVQYIGDAPKEIIEGLGRKL